MTHSGRLDLQKEIASAVTSLPKGLFCYLTLTSKSEGSIRDWVSYRLHKRLKTYGLSVGREFQYKGKKADIAILDSAREDPVAIVEITRVGNATRAAYDNGKRPRKRPQGVRKVEKDLQRWRKQGVCNCFGLFLVSENRGKASGKGDQRALKYLLKNSSRDLDGTYMKVEQLAKNKALKTLAQGRTSRELDKWFMASSRFKWWLFILK